MALFLRETPKGFEKYFKPESKNKEVKTKSKDGQETKDKPEPKPKPAPQKPSSSSTGQQGSKPYDQWSFGLFGGTGSRWVQL